MKTKSAKDSKKTVSSLEVRDHTEIIDFIMRNRSQLRGKVKSSNAAEIMKAGAALSKNSPKRAQMFKRAAIGVQHFEDSLRQIDASDPTWQSARPVVARIAKATSIQELISILDSQSKKSALGEPIRIGCKVAKEIIEDGAGTIYDDGVQPTNLWDPRQIIGEAGSVSKKLTDMAEGAKERVADIAASDAAGAVVGAVAGAAVGAVTGAGAAAGAAAGAIEGAITESAKAEME